MVEKQQFSNDFYHDFIFPRKSMKFYGLKCFVLSSTLKMRIVTKNCMCIYNVYYIMDICIYNVCSICILYMLCLSNIAP